MPILTIETSRKRVEIAIDYCLWRKYTPTLSFSRDRWATGSRTRHAYELRSYACVRVTRTRSSRCVIPASSQISEVVVKGRNAHRSHCAMCV